jgi:HrpA-like RNA helicase
MIRLFSDRIMNEADDRQKMAEHPLPEMMRLSLSDLALRIKIIKVNLGSSIEDVLSRALDPPAPINVQRAISMLVEVQPSIHLVGGTYKTVFCRFGR